MKNDDRMTARLTARFALAGCAALLPLSIAWAAAPPRQSSQSEAPEKPSTAQETPKPEAPAALAVATRLRALCSHCGARGGARAQQGCCAC